MTDRILVDTNVWLDILLDREPHVDDSAAALSLAQRHGATLVVGATTVTTIFYFVDKLSERERASDAVEQLLDNHEVAAVGGDVLRSALDADLSDFEDGVLHEAARRHHVDLLITRNASDFEQGGLPVSTPSEYVAAHR
ncbi:MAG: PIN domain-containing protein [Bradymonadaceae bacterium]